VDKERKSPSNRYAHYKSGGKTPQYDYRNYYWGEIKAGDCHQIDGVISFRSDGVGTFDATVWTDHTTSGDIWHSKFSVNKDDHRPLLDTQTMDSPKTFGAHAPMHGDFLFDPGKFAELPTDYTQVFQLSSC
jgi:hypothetical protein